MKSRRQIRLGWVKRRVVGLLLGALAVPLFLLLGSSSADAATLCLPKADETGCISGTVGSRANPVEGVDVALLDEQGTEVETVTTGADGKFSFAVTKAGNYLLKLDPASLPKGMELLPPQAALQGPGDTVKVDGVTLGSQKAPILQVRSADFNAGGKSFGAQVAQSIVNGLRLGLLLALASLGLSLIYGTTGLSNFAHAEQVTLGGMVAYGLVNVNGVNLWVGIVATTVICAATGYAQDRLMWQPLRRRGLGLTQMLVVTIGLSLAMQYSFQYAVGASLKKVIVKDFGTTTFGPVTITKLSFLAMGIAIVMIAGVGYVLVRTRVGQATRAVSDNPALAAASGIDVDKIIRMVWTASAGLAGLAGVLYALVVSNGIRWDTGMQILLLLFAAVTLGGLGTAFGAFVGSIVIGLVVELAGPLGAPGDLKYAVALGMLILLLLVRPQGILGRAERVG